MAVQVLQGYFSARCRRLRWRLLTRQTPLSRVFYTVQENCSAASSVFAIYCVVYPQQSHRVKRVISSTFLASNSFPPSSIILPVTESVRNLSVTWPPMQIGDLGATQATEEDSTAPRSAIPRNNFVCTFNVAGVTTVIGASSPMMRQRLLTPGQVRLPIVPPQPTIKPLGISTLTGRDTSEGGSRDKTSLTRNAEKSCGSGTKLSKYFKATTKIIISS